MKEVKIKVPANAVYEFGNFGDIKTKGILPYIYSQKEASKKKYSVTESIANLLWEGKEVKKAYYDMLTNEVILNVSDLDWHECPKCNLGYEGYPALSREDNKTEICPACGQKEAMSQWVAAKMIEKVKEDYPQGTRIKLIRMGEDIHRVEDNTRGTVTNVDDTGTIHCEFDDGRCLGIIPGVDIFRKIIEDESNKRD